MENLQIIDRDVYREIGLNLKDVFNKLVVENTKQFQKDIFKYQKLKIRKIKKIKNHNLAKIIIYD